MLKIHCLFSLFIISLLFLIIADSAHTQITENSRFKPINPISAGAAIDISGDTLIIGAKNADVPGTPNVGAVYVNEIDSCAKLVRQQILTPSNPIKNTNYGER